MLIEVANVCPAESSLSAGDSISPQVRWSDARLRTHGGSLSVQRTISRYEGMYLPNFAKNAFLVKFDQRSHAASLILTRENALNGRRDKSPLGIATRSVLISPRLRFAAAGSSAPVSIRLGPGSRHE